MTSPTGKPLEILLFDMDGVLLIPAGYHRALQETVARIGQALGFPAVHLTPEAIAQFEAAGATSEWDSSAICAALLLIRVWEIHPDARLTTASLTVPFPTHRLPIPDFLAFAQVLAETRSDHRPPLDRAADLLFAQTRPKLPQQVDILLELLRSARDFSRSPTHRLFQELVLGSEMFAALYRHEPMLEIAGYLATYDQPALDHETRKSLNTWLAATDHRAAIFTNRPTREPGDRAGTPEGEIGRATSGFQGLPLIGWGHLTWLSASQGFPEEYFSKPAAGHALAALRCALGDPVEAALQAAADLQLGRRASGWEPLAGARISAFEDGAAGLVSASAAGRLLADQGILSEIRLFGVSREPTKRQALTEVGGLVYGDLKEALGAAGVLEQ